MNLGMGRSEAMAWARHEAYKSPWPSRDAIWKKKLRMAGLERWDGIMVCLGQETILALDTLSNGGKIFLFYRKEKRQMTIEENLNSMVKMLQHLCPKNGGEVLNRLMEHQSLSGYIDLNCRWDRAVSACAKGMSTKKFFHLHWDQFMQEIFLYMEEKVRGFRFVEPTEEEVEAERERILSEAAKCPLEHEEEDEEE